MPPPYGQAFQAPPYGQPFIAPPYGQPYVQTPYGQAYAQVPPGPQAYGPSPYSQFAQAQYGQPAPKQKAKKEKKKSDGKGLFGTGRKSAAILVIIIRVACVASGVGGGLIGANMIQAPNITYEGGSMVTIEPSYDITTTEAVAKKALPSVVGIETVGSYMVDDFFYGPSEQEVTGIGTGMIIDMNGFVLTNSHVVLDGSVNSITVHLSTGEAVEGRLIWNDRGLDLAIIKVEATGLSPVEFGDSDEVLIGSYAAAIGNPLGLEFSGSITSGVVSGLNRTITVADQFTGGTVTMSDLIQVDAAINSGNSGGPLLNNRGQVIGINTAKATAEGMGFAIPINIALPIVEKVLRDGTFERVFMGVSAADVSVVRENWPNVVLFVDQGACITEVNPGSPAEKAGLRPKDVIIAIDGHDITGSDSLIKLLLGYEAGNVITVTFDRDGETMEAKLTLMSQSELDAAQQEENPFRNPQGGNSGR
jgi:S1-C subfamily serine protease